MQTLNLELGIESSLCPVSQPDGPAPASKPSPVLRPGSQEFQGPGKGLCRQTTADSLGILHPVRAPTEHVLGCSLLLGGNMPRQNVRLQPGVEGEVPTICSVKKQIPLALPSQTAWMKLKTGSRGIPAPTASFSVSYLGSWAEGTTTAPSQSIREPALSSGSGYHRPPTPMTLSFQSLSRH